MAQFLCQTEFVCRRNGISAADNGRSFALRHSHRHFFGSLRKLIEFKNAHRAIPNDSFGGNNRFGEETDGFGADVHSHFICGNVVGIDGLGIGIFGKFGGNHIVNGNIARVAQGKSVVHVQASEISKIKISYPESYQQIIIRPSGSANSDNESSLDSLPLIRSQFPTAQFSKERGCFYRDGYNYVPAVRYRYSVREVVADSSQPYYEGGILPTLQIDVPECIPSTSLDAPIFIGQVQYLNSSLKLFSSDGSESVPATDMDKSSDDTMYLMLAFAYRVNSTTGGTVTNYGVDDSYTYHRLGDYSLIYNGDDGIFERFYRKYDTLLRNSMHEVEAQLNLPMSVAQNLSAIGKVNIQGVDLLINTMKFSVGTKSNLSEASLYTVNIYEPVTSAKNFDDIIPPLVSTGYKWEIKSSYQDISEDDYNNSIYKDAEIPAIFPLQPTANDVGKQSYVRKLAEKYTNLSGKSAWRITTFWLEAVAE